MNDCKANVLKRFQDALRGGRLSGTAAHDINSALCAGHAYRHYCEQGDKLPGIHKADLQAIVDRMIAEGIKPSKSLLSPHQKAALKKRENSGT
jgi:hypothetical protein